MSKQITEKEALDGLFSSYLELFVAHYSKTLGAGEKLPKEFTLCLHTSKRSAVLSLALEGLRETYLTFDCIDVDRAAKQNSVGIPLSENIHLPMVLRRVRATQQDVDKATIVHKHRLTSPDGQTTKIRIDRNAFNAFSAFTHNQLNNVVLQKVVDKNTQSGSGYFR